MLPCTNLLVKKSTPVPPSPNHQHHDKKYIIQGCCRGPKYIQRGGPLHVHDGRFRYSAMDVPGTAHDRMPHQSRTTFTHCTDRIIPPHTLIRQSSHFNRTILAYQSNSLHPNRIILAHNNRTVLALQSGNIHTPIGQCSHINRKLITPQSGDLHTPIG